MIRPGFLDSLVDLFRRFWRRLKPTPFDESNDPH